MKHPDAPLRAVDWKQLCAANVDLQNLPTGQITCLTCHLPHGKPSESGEQVSPARLASTKPMLRPNVAQRLCAKCHGFDAIHHYLYYHSAAAARRPEKD